MKRFRFNLEVLLRVYRLDEEEKKKKLGEANREMLVAEQDLVNLGREYDGSQESERTVREQGESAGRMRLYVLYMFDLKQRIERQKVTVREKHIRVRAARDKLVESRRRVKALERLRERRKEIWVKERRRFEMKRLDDVCSQQFIRLHQEEGAPA
ncbi:MAG: flagellar export protein FliJ [Fibrobacterota bacterium]